MVGWMIDGFQTVILVWLWVALVVIGAAWRSLYGPEIDPIRPAGPPA